MGPQRLPVNESGRISTSGGTTSAITHGTPAAWLPRRRGPGLVARREDEHVDCSLQQFWNVASGAGKDGAVADTQADAGLFDLRAEWTSPTSRIARQDPPHHLGGDGEQEFVILLLDEPPDMTDDQRLPDAVRGRAEPDVVGSRNGPRSMP